MRPAHILTRNIHKDMCLCDSCVLVYDDLWEKKKLTNAKEFELVWILEEESD